MGTILGVDPGKGEINVAALRDGRVRATERVILSVEEVSDLTDPRKLHSLRKVARSLWKKFRPEVAVIERMMLRPGRGSPVEVINICLGVLLSTVPKTCKVHLVTAAAWKNWLKRRTGGPEAFKKCSNCKKASKCDHSERGEVCLLWRELEPWQKLALEDLLSTKFPTVHEADAAGMAYYVYESK